MNKESDHKLLLGDTAHSFKGKTVLVTGSSRNLGYTIAASFAAAGGRILLHGSPANVQGAQNNLQKRYPDAEVHAMPFDLRDSEAISKAFADMESRNLMPDILVNNAAHLGVGEEDFLEMSPEYFREVMEVNLFGAFQCAQLTARALKAKGTGAIVNISSLAGKRGIYGRSAYNVSKAALDGLTRSMAQELAEFGIRVNSLVLGYVWTERWESLEDGVEERRLKNVPVRKPSSQEEIARAVLFLASGETGTLTGAQVVLDGGLNIQQLPGDITV